MGNRRIGRKRLYGVEKKGRGVNLGASAGIEPAIVHASQHRQGQELITEIQLDLGTSEATLQDGSGTAGVIGVAGKNAAITQLTVAKYGVITEIRGVLLEALDSALDVTVSLHTADVATDSTAPTPTSVADLSVVGHDKSHLYDASTATADKYLFLEQGGSADNDGTLSQGKLVIYIHGFVVPADK